MAIMTTVILFSNDIANAHPRFRPSRPFRMARVVAQPGVTANISHLFTHKERFRMVMAYLKNHEYLTARRYAQMTGLSKATGKAELDAFAADKDKPIKAVTRGKKEVYVLNRLSKP